MDSTAYSHPNKAKQRYSNNRKSSLQAPGYMKQLIILNIAVVLSVPCTPFPRTQGWKLSISFWQFTPLPQDRSTPHMLIWSDPTNGARATAHIFHVLLIHHDEQTADQSLELPLPPSYYSRCSSSFLLPSPWRPGY